MAHMDELWIPSPAQEVIFNFTRESEETERLSLEKCQILATWVSKGILGWGLQGLRFKVLVPGR